MPDLTVTRYLNIIKPYDIYVNVLEFIINDLFVMPFIVICLLIFLI
jgi:hypothetical protein